MNISLTKIGNSKGIIIPAHLVKEFGLEDEVELKIHEDFLSISKKKNPRDGWEESFAAAGPDDEDWSDWLNMPAATMDEDDWTWDDK